jgi:CubicO group peptidase (beta-lactamase class C family)
MKKTITTLLIITTLITLSFASQTNTFYLDPITYKDTSTKSNIELTANQKYQNQYKDLVKKLESLNHVKSFLVMKDGQLIVEEYFHSTKPEDSNNIHSASKSILSALVGIAIEEGYIKSIYQPISDFLPREYFIGQSRLKKKITIYNLLTMTSGLKWEEDVTEYQIQNEKDWAKGILSQKQDKYPGKSFNYSTGDTYLLGLVIQNATGKELKTYMEENS